MFGIKKRAPTFGWAEILFEGVVPKPEKYSAAFLEALTEQQAGNDLRIIMDCARIVRTTKNDQTRAMRKRLAEERYAHFCKLKPFFSDDQARRFKPAEQAMKEIRR